MKKICVTGGDGFIGQAVMQYGLDCGYTMTSFDRREGNDVTNIDPLPLGDVDSVVHLAGVLGTAELFDSPHEAIDVNIHGTLNVLQHCEKTGASFVNITMPPVFPSVYTTTKICADRLASLWNMWRGVQTSHVRAFNAYGPGQRHGPGHPQKIIPTFASLAWEGKPLPIWGSGEQTVDLIDTEDLARMLIDATRWGDDVTFDAGTGVAFTVNRVAEMVNEITGNAACVEYLPMRDGEIETHIVAVGAGWDRLDWHPEFRENRFIETVLWYRPK